MPVIPATQEAEAGNHLNLGAGCRSEPEIVPLYSSLGDRARLCLKNKQTKNIFAIASELGKGWEKREPEQGVLCDGAAGLQNITAIAIASS